MSRPLALAGVSLVLMHLAIGRVYTECELAMELRRQEFPEYQIKEWLCLIQAESTRNTAAVGGPDADGSYDYGLFQINDKYWCSHDAPGNGCNILCTELFSDDITVASKCALLIYGRQGFNAWAGWKNECRGKTLPDVVC